MKRNLKLVSLVLGVYLLSPLLVFAQSDIDWDKIKQEIELQGENIKTIDVPNINAINLVLFEEKVFEPGDVVNGYFRVKNSSSFAAEKIMPTLSLVGDFEGNVPYAIYDVYNELESFSLNPEETRNIEFSYKLPEKLLSSDLGIQLEFFLEGGLRGDSMHKKIDSELSGNFADISSPLLGIRDNVYDLRVTPALYEGDDFFVEFEVESSSEMKVIPFVDFYEFSANTGEKIDSISFDEIDISSESQTVSLSMDKNFDGGLYEGTLVLKDTNGVVVSETVMFLFMAVGDGTPFMIRNVVLNDQKEDDKYVVDVSFTAGAMDIDYLLFGDQYSVEEFGEMTDGLPDYSNVSVEVDVFDSLGNSVGSGLTNFENSEGFSYPVKLNLNIQKTGDYKVVAKAMDGRNTVLDTFEKEIRIFAEEMDEERDYGFFDNKNNIVYAGLIILLIVFIILFYSRKDKNPFGDLRV